MQGCHRDLRSGYRDVHTIAAAMCSSIAAAMCSFMVSMKNGYTKEYANVEMEISVVQDAYIHLKRYVTSIPRTLEPSKHKVALNPPLPCVFPHNIWKNRTSISSRSCFLHQFFLFFLNKKNLPTFAKDENEKTVGQN